MTATAHTALGFPDPVHDAQTCFRALMQAVARPGTVQAYRPTLEDAPAPLTAMGAALALTLLDYDTPVWLDAPLADSDAPSYLRFYTGAPITRNPLDAAFALIADPSDMISLGNFAPGIPEYPDRSATLILLDQTFTQPKDHLLQGPGIKNSIRFSSGPVPGTFWQDLQENNARFPLGVDLIFAGSGQIAAIPRSTTVTIAEN